MKKEKKFNIFDSQIAKGIFITVSSSLLISIFILIVKMNETIKYVIPHKEELQDMAIKRLAEQDKVIIKTFTEKNKNSQKRINEVTDGWKLIHEQLMEMNSNQKDINMKLNLVFKTVKELKQYKDLVLKKDEPKSYSYLFTEKTDSVKLTR